MRFKKLFYLLLGLTLAFHSDAQPSLFKNKTDVEWITKALNHIYNYEFEESELIIKTIKQRNPRHPVVPFLHSLVIYWEQMPISVENPKFQLYHHLLEETIKKSEQILSNKEQHSEANFFLLLSYSSLVYVRVKAHDYLKAIGDAKKAYQYMKEGFELKQDFPDFYFSTGLYNYYSVQYPENHKALSAFMLFFSKGNKKNGLLFIETASKEAVLTKIEALFFLAHLNLKYENNPHHGLVFTQILVKKFPKNLLYLTKNIEALSLTNQFHLIKNQNQVLRESKIHFFQMVSYIFEGMQLELGENNPEAAMKAYEQAIKIAEKHKKTTGDYLAFAYIGLSRIYAKKKDKNKAVFYLKKGESMSEHTYLKKEVEMLKAEL
jgi:tetratricopeptide (TPR) repeat protein